MSTYEVPANYNGPGFNGSPEQPAPRKGKRGRKDSGAPKPTRRVVGTQRRLFLIFAVLVGLTAVLAINNSTSKTYVARTALPVNAFTEIGEAQIEIVAVDEGSIEPDTFSGSDSDEVLKAVLDAITGKRTATQLGAQQQLRLPLFIDVLSPSTPLGPDERLLSISARAGSAVIGTIRTGDRVDVYGTTSQGLSGLLGSDIEVVAVSVAPDQLDSASQEQIDNKEKGLADLVPGNPIPGTYVLRIRTADVSRYIAADSGGTIYLALRGRDAGQTTSGPADVESALCGTDRSIRSCTRN